MYYLPIKVSVHSSQDTLIVFILARTMVVYTLDCPCGFCGIAVRPPRPATGYTCTKLTVLLAERRVVSRMHMGSWRRVPRYGHIRSRHIEWSTHRGAKGLVRVMINDLINKYADDIVISVPLRIRGPPGGLSSSR